MGFFSKIFKEKETASTPIKAPLDLAIARQKEKEFLTDLTDQPNFSANDEVKCLAQILINETDFLVSSDRVPKHKR
jgi:hypothetical protein